VLVVTCPCALSLATPAAMLASAGALAKQGVLVRQMKAVEALADIDTVIFDKTGTLTSDSQCVDQEFVVSDLSIVEVLSIAASMAEKSLHPLSKALVNEFRKYESSALVKLDDIQEFVAQGLESNGIQRYRLGTSTFCQQWGAIIPVEAQKAQVHLCDSNRWLASWSFKEDLREDAVQTLNQLRSLAIEVQLLSGDQSEAVSNVASLLNIDKAWGGRTPAQKLQYLQDLQAKGRRVLMVGDGLNDGPVLAGAHVSMAIGHAAALTQSNSDFVLMGSHLSVVAQSVKLSRKTMQIVKQNLAWAVAYNVTCVPLAALGFLPAWAAGLGMASSSLWVVLNSLRLSRSL
jgi:P-type Cu2+ transporter